MQDWGGDADVGNDEATFDGSISMAGKAMGLDGQVHEVGYDVDVKASAGSEWESDESPTGWNYNTDQPTYTSTSYLSVGDAEIQSIEFSDGMAFYVDGDDLFLADAQKLFHPSTMKQLLNPDIYKKIIGSIFDKKAENIEPSSADDYYDEPERDYGDSRY